MMKTMNAIGDRLLGLFVPGVTASADPCHSPYYSTCRCDSNYKRYIRFCCKNGGCGSCYQSGGC